ncbi:hypothetical protein M752DRAFT_156517 [Aspergillus phoenicis ATCC 13157]|uniref:Uncharacterized protein n=1 Tax=Aspergillus phoenicis ATCC 13157 TaxID=1353007 RepID=A0A370PNB2_ASPPH|nr:hypothetical protein M752DRAFT_156517 [Aspergillus phoenicis ATCC 13157]
MDSAVTHTPNYHSLCLWFYISPRHDTTNPIAINNNPQVRSPQSVNLSSAPRPHLSFKFVPQKSPYPSPSHGKKRKEKEANKRDRLPHKPLHKPRPEPNPLIMRTGGRQLGEDIFNI